LSDDNEPSDVTVDFTTHYYVLYVIYMETHLSKHGKYRHRHIKVHVCKFAIIAKTADRRHTLNVASREVHLTTTNVPVEHSSE